MALTQTKVSQLYVAIFNRASEGAGNTYWQTANTNATTTAEAMFLLPVVKTFFGVTNFTDTANVRTVIEAIYLNSLGKAPADDVAGITYWIGEVTGGRSMGDVVSTLVDSAVTTANAGTAQNVFNNKVAVSNYAADTLSAHTTDAAFQAFLTGVTSVASTVTTANAAILAAVPASNNPGTTFVLTSATDTSTGTANDDTFTGTSSALGSAATLNTTDVIDGGAGTDTLTATLNSNFTGFTSAGSMTGVETVTLLNTGSVARTFDGTNSTGIATYNISGSATTGGVSNLSDMKSIATVNLTGQQGAFTTAMDAAFIKLAGTTDAMTLNLNNVGTAAAAKTATTAAVAEVAVTATLGSIEALTVKATGVNVIATGNAHTSMVTNGAGSLKINTVSTALKTFDGSTATGAIDVDLQAAAAGALTSIKTGGGADTITIERADTAANAIISGGAGLDSLELISANTGVVQYVMTGVETLALTNVDAAVTFSASKSSGITTISNVAANGAATQVVGLGATNMTFNDIGATVDAGDVTADHTGTSILNYNNTAAEVALKASIVHAADYIIAGTTGLTVNVNDYSTLTGAVITAAAATSVVLNVADAKTTASTPVQATSFNGSIVAAEALSFSANVLGGIVSTAAITVDKATQGFITNGGTVGSINMQAAKMQELTIVSGAAFDMNISDLSAIQVFTATINDGLLDMTDAAVTLDKLSTMTLAGTGVAGTTTTASSATFTTLGGDNAYDMNIVASGLVGGFTATTVNVAAGQNITANFNNVTGAVIVGTIGNATVGANVTLNTAGTGGAVDYSSLIATGTVTVTNSGLGAFDIGIVSAGVTGDVVYKFDGTLGAVTTAAISGKTVNYDASDTIGGDDAVDMTVFTGATVAVSTLQTNSVTVTAATNSTAVTIAVTGGTLADAISVIGAATTTSLTLTGNYGAGVDTIAVDTSNTTAAGITTDISAVVSYATSIITGDTTAIDTVKFGVGVDTFKYAASGAVVDIFTDFKAGTGGDVFNLEIGGGSDITAEFDAVANATIQNRASQSVTVFADGADGAGASAITDYTNTTQVAAFLELQLDVASGETFGAVINDLITDKAFIYAIVEAGGIRITIDAGEVVLIGTVTMSNADVAISAAQNITFA